MASGELLNEARNIGESLVAIDKALEHFRVAYNDKHLGELRIKFFSQPLYLGLNRERQRYRRRLLELNEELREL